MLPSNVSDTPIVPRSVAELCERETRSSFVWSDKYVCLSVGVDERKTREAAWSRSVVLDAQRR